MGTMPEMIRVGISWLDDSAACCLQETSLGEEYYREK